MQVVRGFQQRCPVLHKMLLTCMWAKNCEGRDEVDLTRRGRGKRRRGAKLWHLLMTVYVWQDYFEDS